MHILIQFSVMKKNEWPELLRENKLLSRKDLVFMETVKDHLEEEASD